MNQVQCVPQVSPVMPPQYAVASQQPSYNAVKIDILNPSLGAPGMAPAVYPQAQYAPVTAPMYNYPQAPVYNYPQADVNQQVCYMPPVQQFPSLTTAPQQQLPPVQPYVVQPQAQPMIQPQMTQPIVQPQAVPPYVQQQNYNAPVQPQVVNNTPAVPQPQVSAQPEVVAPVTPQPQVDLNGFIARLANPDFEGQAAAMEEIANMVKENPQKATELVDTKVFEALNNIVKYDSSSLEGPSQAQIDARQKIMENKQVTDEENKLANTMAPKELAERNKSYALFTIAIMDKLYADEVAKLSNNTVPLTELPEAITVVDQLKDNPNPMVRASAIEALSYIQNPEYKKDLTTLFTVAKNDQDAGVVQAANAALEKLNQI